MKRKLLFWNKYGKGMDLIEAECVYFREEDDLLYVNLGSKNNKHIIEEHCVSYNYQIIDGNCGLLLSSASNKKTLELEWEETFKKKWEDFKTKERESYEKYVKYYIFITYFA